MIRLKDNVYILLIFTYFLSFLKKKADVFSIVVPVSLKSKEEEFYVGILSPNIKKKTEGKIKEEETD